MAKGKRRNITNRNLGNMAASEPNFPTTASPGHPNTLEKQDFGFKITVHDAARGTQKGYK